MRPTNDKGNIRMTTPEAVDKGVAIFSKLEAKADECVNAASGLLDVFDAICKDGHISKFEANALSAEAMDIVMHFRAAVLIFHAKTTQRAQLKGIDVPQPLDGGGHR